MTVSFRRALLAVAVVSAVLAPEASAATLTYNAGVLTYTGTDVGNDVGFTRTNPSEVRVTRSDGDPINVAPGAPPCSEDVAGSQYTCFPVTRVVARGNGGNDELDGEPLLEIPADVDGGPGDDLLDGGSGADTVTGAAGVDEVDGNDGNDQLDAGDGADVLFGDAGVDTLIAGAGDDMLIGGPGNDVERGDGGDDEFVGSPGSDDHRGGDGFDEVILNFLTAPPRPGGLVSLDDVANDALSTGTGEGDNVHADIEGARSDPSPFEVLLFGGGSAPPSNDVFTGNAAANSLSTGAGDDTVDGGTNNDLLSAGDGTDTVRARDGFKDFVNCGAGTDTAEVDTLDDVQECETVNSANVGNANDVPEIPEDAAPTVALTGPASGALLRTSGPTEVTATATDDRGVAQVLFIDDDRIVCADAAAPYTCGYQPRGEDVGRNTLVAVAVDTAQQTASTTRAFNVDRFAVAGITGAVTPARDVRAPFVFRTSGRLRLPPFVSAALGCADGQVSVQVKAGSKTISTRRADLRRDCTFSSTVRFANRARFTRNGQLRFTLRFTGNEILNRSAAVARNVRTRNP